MRMSATIQAQNVAPRKKRARKTKEKTNPVTAIKNGFFLSRQQVAELLNLSVESIKRYERRKLLRAVRLNARVIRYRAEDVQALIAAAS